MAFRPPLSAALQNIVLGEQPAYPNFPTMGATTSAPPIPPATPAMKPRSKGQMIAGIIGDMLAAGVGRGPSYGPMVAAERQQQQQMDATEAQWSRRRQAENEDWTQRQQWQRNNPDPSPILRDIAAWQAMTPEQRAAYQAMKDAQGGPVNMTLPNGQFYSGPRSGLAEALAGAGNVDNTPTVEDGFQYTPGPGGRANQANWKPMGGQTVAPSATFSGSFRGLPGETVTSTFRTPEHNREVGGVANSYHTRRDARGNPMARDSVPPPGMDMSAYYRLLKAANPHLEVINEGDHVHMEPRG